MGPKSPTGPQGGLLDRALPSTFIILDYIPYHILYTTLHYTTLHYTTLHYTTLHYTILYYTILYYNYTILYYTILYYTILYYTVLYSAILNYTILYSTILYYIILYYTAGLLNKGLLSTLTHRPTAGTWSPRAFPSAMLSGISRSYSWLQALAQADQISRGPDLVSCSLDWLAVQELNLSYHHMDIYQQI